MGMSIDGVGMWFNYSRMEHPVQSVFSMHAHETCELLYFVGGVGTYVVEGSEYRLAPGSVMLMRAGETHMMHIVPGTPYERYVINFSPAQLAGMDPEGRWTAPFRDRPLGQKNLYTAAQLDTRRIRSCFDMIYATADADPYVQRTTMQAGLAVILCEIERAYLMGNAFAAQAPQGLIAGVVDYINRHLTEELSLDLLAKRFFLSKSYLNQQFRQATGTTIWDYVLLKRLMQARSAIRSGVPATEAFRASGFNDYSSFYRRYKGRFGVAPNADRPKGTESSTGTAENLR